MELNCTHEFGYDYVIPTPVNLKNYDNLHELRDVEGKGKDGDGDDVHQQPLRVRHCLQ